MLKKLDLEEGPIKELHEDVINNFSLEDVRGVNPRSSEPSSEQIDKGKFSLGEISGVPVIYYRTTAGVIYKWEGTAV